MTDIFADQPREFWLEIVRSPDTPKHIANLDERSKFWDQPNLPTSVVLDQRARCGRSAMLARAAVLENAIRAYLA